MNILILEDRAITLRQMEDILNTELPKMLRDAPPHLFGCSNLYRANEYLKKENINLIITDLAMRADGLDKDVIMQTKFGVLTGWVWLENNVFPDHENIHVILFSEFIDDWKNDLRSKGLDEATITEQKNVIAIPKLSSQNMDPYDDLIRAIKKQISLIQKRSK